MGRKILRRAVVCAMICVVTVAGFYLSLIFAIDSRPDLGSRNPDGDVDRQLNLWGAIFFAFALLIYFVHIPSNLAADEYRAGHHYNSSVARRACSVCARRVPAQ